MEIARNAQGRKVVGVDLSPQLIRIAKAAFESPSVEFVCSDISLLDRHCSFRERFDACVLIDVYEHFPEYIRTDFHRKLASLMTPNGIVIVTCPTTLHQGYLRAHDPSGLQPIDTDVELHDIIEFARDIDGDVAYFELKSIWATHDYFHSLIVRGLRRTELARRYTRGVSILPKADRIKYLRKLHGTVPDDFLTDLVRRHGTRSGRFAGLGVRGLKRILGKYL
jgi:SAM-dependent methyltransferase